MSALLNTALRAALSSFTSSSDFASLDRAALRSLIRSSGIVVADRKILDRSSEMRALLADALAEIQAEDERIAAEEAARLEAEAQALLESQAVVVATVEEVPVKKERTSKWGRIVSSLWDLREENAVEVRISAEKLQEMGLPSSAAKFPAYWCANPPGLAAKALGLNASLRKNGDSRILILSLLEG